MKKVIRYFLRTLLAVFTMLVLLVVFMLNPQIVYAKKHTYKQVTVYSKHTYPAGYDAVIDKALELVKQSELYKPEMGIDLFLNDGNGASVKFVLKKVFGNAFAWGYHNNVVLNGTTDGSLKWVAVNGYRRSLPRLVAHEMIHCYQLKRLGLINASPIGNVAIWKREGYAEYICHKSSFRDETQILKDAVREYENGKNNESFNWAEVTVDEGKSFAGKDYYRYWILVKYLCDVKKFNFDELIKTETPEDEVYKEVLNWYKALTLPVSQ